MQFQGVWQAADFQHKAGGGSQTGGGRRRGDHNEEVGAVCAGSF
jgi:hypothetical protein